MIEVEGSIAFVSSFGVWFDLPAGSSYTFTIQFTAGTGVAEALVEIHTNAAGDLAIFQFAVGGEGVPLRLYVDSTATGAS